MPQKDQITNCLHNMSISELPSNIGTMARGQSETNAKKGSLDGCIYFWNDVDAKITLF